MPDTPGKLIALNPAQILAIVQERDTLEDWQNSVASRMGDNFDGDEGQEWIIDRWLDLVEERLRDVDPPWHRYLFLSGPDPRTDEEEAAPSGEAPPAGPLPWRPL